jgi:hypothetical protein
MRTVVKHSIGVGRQVATFFTARICAASENVELEERLDSHHCGRAESAVPNADLAPNCRRDVSYWTPAGSGVSASDSGEKPTGRRNGGQPKTIEWSTERLQMIASSSAEGRVL